MKKFKYKNMKNQPLPIALKGRSISVGNRQVFDVDESEVSPVLLRLVRIGSVRLLETVDDTTGKEAAPQVVPESTPPEPEYKRKNLPDPEPKSEPEPELQVEVFSQDEKDDDSLTNVPGSVESEEDTSSEDTEEDETTDSEDKKKGKRKPKSRRRGR